MNYNTENGVRLCSIEGCESKHYGKGYCGKHYQRLKHHGDPLFAKFEPGVKKKCSIEGCNGFARRLGWCQKHSSRQWRNGDPNVITRAVNRQECMIDGCNSKPHKRVSAKVNRTEKYCYEHLYTNDEHKARNAKRRAMRKNADINDLTKKDWNECLVAFDNSCCYCGSTANLQLEHLVPLALKGNHTKSNVAPACASCNCSKQDTPIDEWYIKQPFYSKEREDKIVEWLGR